MAREDTTGDAYSYLSSVNHQPRAGTIENLNPDFAGKLAAAIREARAAGLNVGIFSGQRAPNTLTSQGRTGSAASYDAAGRSLHTYGMAVDVDGIGKAGSPEAKQWQEIATRNGIYNPYGYDNGAEFNHYQALPYKNLSDTDVASLRAAYQSGDQKSVWALGSNLIGGGTQYAGPGVPGTTVNSANAPVAGALAAQPAPANDFYRTSMMHESGGKNIPNAAGGWGAAGGYYQFTPPTYAGVRAAHPELNLPENIKDASQDQQTAAYKELTRGNVEALQKAGVPITDKNVFMASFLGGGGATAFIQQMNQNPAANAADLFPREAKANPTVFYDKGQPRTLQQVFDLQTKMHSAENTTGFGPNAAPSATASASPPAEQSLWQKITSPQTDAQGAPIAGGKSPLQQAASAFEGKDKGSSLQQFKQAQEDEAPEGAVKNQAGATPGARNTSPMGGALLPSVPQTYGATLNSFSQPLTWNSAPPRVPQMPAAGLQGAPGYQVPGTTLNSVQPPRAVGYGINQNVGYGDFGYG